MAVSDPRQDETFRLSDGRQIGFCQYGRQDGMPVLALHGTPGSRLKYRIAHDIAERHGLRLIAADRWGYGLTTAHAQPSLAAFADDYAELMAHCGCARFAVVGISGGGPFAVAVAACRPDSVSRLALVAPVGQVSAAECTGEMGWFHWMCFRVLPKIPGAVRAAFEIFRCIAHVAPAGAVRVATMRAGRADQILMRSYAKRLPLGLAIKEGLRRGAKGPVIDLEVFSRPWRVNLAAIACPSHLWIGDDDRNVPIEVAVALQHTIAQCALTRLPAHGHFWISNNFDDVLGWLAASD